MKHGFIVVEQFYPYLAGALAAQAKIRTETGVQPDIFEQFEDGTVEKRDYDHPQNFIGDASDEEWRRAAEDYNQ